MSQSWKTVRVFIYSTFRDMHAERDYLVRVVFPELRERCAKRRLHLIDVDLRWGVTEEEAERGEALAICLDEIDRCRPFFLGLLGERYGSVPPSYAVPDEPRYGWVRHFEPGHSITAMEIYHGVLGNPAMRARAFFFMRDPSFIEEVPDDLRATFQPEDEQAEAKLKELKDEIRRRCSLFENYPCAYDGVDAEGKVMLSGLEVFGHEVLEDLWSAISEEHSAVAATGDGLAIERAYHEAFAESRSLQFVGRHDLLAKLSEYVDSKTLAPLVVSGAAGCGKSALLANFATKYVEDHPNTFVVTHFVGVSPGSTDIRLVLKRISREIVARFQIRRDIPDDYYELRRVFVEVLKTASSRAKIVLIIDALDQLDESHHARYLDWLPQRMPGKLKLLVSAAEGDCLDELRRRRPTAKTLTIGGLGDDEQKELVRQTLWAYRKRLDERPEDNQMETLLGKSGSGSPLYLTVACEEMRVFGRFEHLSERVSTLPDDVDGLFEQVLERIERDHGRELVASALSLLCCSRHGLLESEMLDLLRREGESEFSRATWARLYRSLQFYLHPPGESGEGLLDFFHRQLATAARQRYLAIENNKVATHRRLAEYFLRKADPTHDGRWVEEYSRALGELPYQLLEGRLYAQLYHTARDESFLTAQARSFPDDLDVSVNTIRAAIEGSSRSDNATAAAEFLLAHARRLAELRRESPLTALRAGLVERARQLADLTGAERRLLWYLLLAWELGDKNRSEAQAMLRPLLQKSLPQLTGWEGDYAVYLLTETFGIDDVSSAPRHKRILGPSEQGKLCSSLAERGHFAHAMKMAQTENPSSQAYLMQEIAVAQARSGLAEAAASTFAFALDSLRRVKDEGDRVLSMRWIGESQFKAGQIESARKTFDEVLEIAARHWSKLDQVETLRDIALVQARSGEREAARHSFDQAIEIARRDPVWQQSTFQEIAVAQAQAGEFDAALITAQEIEAVHYRIKALAEIAEAQAQVGELEAARGTLAHAIEIARGSKEEERQSGLYTIAVAQAQTGEFTAALETVRELGHGRPRAGVLREVALAQAHAGQLEAATQTFAQAVLATSDLGRAKAEMLAEIAAAQAQASEFAAARATVREIDEERYRSSALLQIAAAQARGGDADAARDTLAAGLERAERTDWTEVQANTLLRIALAQAGNLEEARNTFAAADSIVKRIADRNVRTELMRKIAAAQGSARDFTAALETARSLDEEDDRAEVLLMIAVEQARAGHADDARSTFALARKTALEIGEDWIRIGSEATIREETLSMVAARQASVGEFTSALEIASEINDPAQLAAALWAIATSQAEAGELCRRYGNCSED